MKKILSIIMSLILIFLSFTSCSDNNKNQNPDTDNKITPANGGTVKLSCVSVDTMNPIITKHASVSDFLSLIYEGLFVVKPDHTLEGVLASDYTVSDNNTVYTINLKDNIKFHNGRFFTADDVVATLNYMALYTTRWSHFMQYISGYFAKDKHTVVIRLNSSKTDFANNLDFPILPSGLMADDFMPENSSFIPMGTGMYEYDTTIAYKNIMLVANEEWHGGADRAYIDKVNIEILSDEETIISAFDAGTVDALTTSWIGFGDLALASSMFNTFECEDNRFTFVGINCSSMYFDTAKERRILSQGIDNKKITEDIMLGHAVVASSPLRDSVYYNVDTDTIALDSEEEKKNTADTTPIEIRLLYNQESKTKNRIASSIKHQLEAKGYSVYLDAQSKQAYMDKIATGDYELYIGEVKLSQSGDMQFMFSSPYSGICNYDDGEFRALVTNLDLVSDAEAKKVAWENFEKYYKSSVPQIPLYFTNRAVFINKRINGKLKPNLSIPFYGFDDMFIEVRKN